MALPKTSALRWASVEPLEGRRLLAAVAPSDVEQYLVELVNRARANPAAEAARYGIDLNEGLAAGTISATPKQPLAVNLSLVDSARGHTQWMIDTDTFTHAGAGGSTPTARMTAAGYTLLPPASGTGENIAWRGTKPSVPDLVATTARLHQDLFVDSNYPGRGHRVNILDDDFKEIGTGVVAGEFQTYNAVGVTEDFAFTGTRSFLTGVAYTDGVVRDSFYTPGEGLGGITVTARRAADGATFSTTTWDSGGYSVPLAAGTYDVSAAGAGLNGTVRLGNVVIGALNVKRDFLPQPAATSTVSGRHLFYNNSVFDGRDPAATAADLAAVAPDKQALRPGGTGSFVNVTSSVNGINGILIDFAGRPAATLTKDDFVFRSGPGINPALWGLAPAPASVVELPNLTGSNTARYAITWPDGAIKNTWLQVTVKANANTGLAADDVFYFGSLVGETGDNPAALRVTALDLAAVKQTLNSSATFDTRTDFNRDGRVNALDLAAVRSNLAGTIAMFSAP